MENERKSRTRYFRTAVLRTVISPKYLLSLFVTLVMALISIIFLDAMNQALKILSPEIIEAFRTGKTLNIGLLAVSSLSVTEGPFYDEILTGILSGSFMQCLFTVFVSSSICAEYNKGYILYGIMHGQSRANIFNSYVLYSCVITLPLMLAGIAGTAVALLGNDMFRMEDMGRTFGILILQIAMLMCVNICTVSVSMLIRHYAAVGVCTSGILVIPLIPRYIQIFTGGRINIEDGMLLNCIINSGVTEQINVAVCSISALGTAALFYMIGFIGFRFSNFK